MDINQQFLDWIKNNDIEAICNSNQVDNWSKMLNFEWLYPQLIEDQNSCSLVILGYMYRSGNYVARDFKMAIQYLLQSAEQGNAVALNDLGFIYQHGNKNMSQDYEKAFQYYSQSAERGYSGALNNLGYMYQKGLYVKQDYEKAFQYYSRSAEKGGIVALYNLGHMYQHGYYVEKDEEKDKEYKFQALVRGMQYNFDGVFDSKFFRKKYLEQETKISAQEAEIKLLKEKVEALETELACVPEYGEAYLEAKLRFEANQ